MDTAVTIQENCGDIYAEAKNINEERVAQDDVFEDETVEEASEEA